MRPLLWLLGAILLAVVACDKPQPPADDFTLLAEVVEALEGGPVVLRVTLTYHREKPVKLLGFSWYPGDEEGCAFSTPRGWERIEPYMKTAFAPGHRPSDRTIEPGARFPTIAYIHEQFTRIPSGPASLELSWGVEPKGQPQRRITTRLDFDVPRATPERLAAVRRHMEAELDRPDVATDDKAKRVARRILGTRHRAFVPVALRLLASRGGAYEFTKLIDFAYCLAEDPHEVHARLVALACQQDWYSRVDLFNYWRHRRCDDPEAPDEARARKEAEARDPKQAYLVHLLDLHPYWPARRTALAPREFAQLLGAKHIWTRVLTYVTFPDLCPPEWTRDLLEDCRRLTRPLPPAQVAQLRRDLDDDQFAVRERASAALADLGEQAEAPLRQALQTPPSAEAKRRILAALDQIAKKPRPGDCYRVIRYLDDEVVTPEANAVLAALAEGNPDFSLTRYCKEALADFFRRPPLPRK